MSQKLGGRGYRNRDLHGALGADSDPGCHRFGQRWHQKYKVTVYDRTTVERPGIPGVVRLDDATTDFPVQRDYIKQRITDLKHPVNRARRHRNLQPKNAVAEAPVEARKSTRLNSSHVKISYAVFCLKKKNSLTIRDHHTLRLAESNSLSPCE